MERSLYFKIFLLPALCLSLYACNQSKSASPSVIVMEEESSETNELSAPNSQDAVKQDVVDAADSACQANDTIYELPDMLPSYPGGNAAMLTYIGEQLNEPEYRKKVMKLGRVRSDSDLKIVVVKFVVNMQGKIGEAKIVRSIDSEYDKKALDIIKGMPDWVPAQSGGKKVASYFTLPICFELE